MTVFMTGSTGYLGSYVCDHLLRHTTTDLALLVRAPDHASAIAKLWKGWQLHMDVDTFRGFLDRLVVVRGDLHAPDLGLSEAQHAMLRERVDSVLHVAASLNRKSDKACMNTNLRGTLSVLKLARYLHDRRGLERFGFVSTVAIAGHRDQEDIAEDDALDWNRSDYDPYARTKKFCEHMVRELLPDVPSIIYRPSIVMGDPRFPQTTQFDMARATFTLAELPVIPLRPEARVDIVDAPYAGRAIATIHMKDKPAFDTYHLSSGIDAPTVSELAHALAPAIGRPPRIVPQLGRPAENIVRLMNRAPRGTPVQAAGAVMKVFWPYITYDTVFLNDRVRSELGSAPTPFVQYADPMYRWCREHKDRYPYQPLPEGIA